MSEHDTPRKLLEAATRLFAKHGFDGTSTKEIAHEARVNISLISYHFGGKEGLFRACLEDIGKARVESTERLLQPARNIDELSLRLRLFFEELILTHVQYPEVTRILHRDFDLENPRIRDLFQETFLKSFHGLVNFLADAQKKKILDPKLEPTLMAGLVFGSILHTARMNDVSQRYFDRSIADPHNRNQILEHIVRAITTGFINPTSPNKTRGNTRTRGNT